MQIDTPSYVQIAAINPIRKEAAEALHLPGDSDRLLPIPPDHEHHDTHEEYVYPRQLTPKWRICLLTAEVVALSERDKEKSDCE